MSKKASDILFSNAIRAIQKQQYSSDFIQRLTERDHWKASLSKEQMQFIRNRNSCYLGTASAKGRPYIQHRGGHKGFICLPDNASLWFPDYAGNRQYISTGNLSENSQAFLFFMDYRHQRRLKLWGSATLLSQDTYPLTTAQLPNRGKVERIIHFTIEMIDENCNQHIPPLHDFDISQQSLKAETTEITQLKQTIQQLEQKLNENRK